MYFLWKEQLWTKDTRIIVTVITVIFFIMIGIFKEEPINNNNNDFTEVNGVVTVNYYNLFYSMDGKGRTAERIAKHIWSNCRKIKDKDKIILNFISRGQNYKGQAVVDTLDPYIINKKDIEKNITWEEYNFLSTSYGIGAMNAVHYLNKNGYWN